MNQNKQQSIEQISGNLQKMREQMGAMYLTLNSLADEAEAEAEAKAQKSAQCDHTCDLMELSMFSIQEAIESLEYAVNRLQKIAI